jgi:large subunit ribosomal protein L14e
MSVIKVGRKCVLTRGRRAGREVEIVEVIDSNFVKVKDAKGKIRRANVSHLEPL